MLLETEMLWVTLDPEENPPCVGPAHALVQGWTRFTGQQQRKLARALAEASCCTHPDGPWNEISPPESIEDA
jgi:hypothetical protein